MNHCFHANAGLPKMKTTCTIPYPVCCRCGLLVLKNQVSQAASRKPCPGRE